MIVRCSGRAAALLLALVCAGAPLRAQSAEPLFVRPQPGSDLRTSLHRHLVRRAAEYLQSSGQRRQKAIQASEVSAYAAAVRRGLLDTLGEMPLGGPLNVRLVSRHQRDAYTLENVLFESLPGWDVNATVYLPKAERFPPPWPAIVVPVGHSGKQFASYQIPAQVFAQAGYVAVTFDPPGQAGEKQPGNDHFRDGVRHYLFGGTSQRFFVFDALRVIDYLQTRTDVDMRNGVGMTGVSGGGLTTLYAAVCDRRIRAAGPSCFTANPLEHPLRDEYPPCPESLPIAAYEHGLDDESLLVAAAPTPLLMMAGERDEVFKAEWVRELAQRAGAAWQSGRFRFFMDSGGHAYSIAQALEFVHWMDRWVRNIPPRTLSITEKNVEMAPPELLRGSPRPAENMLTLARAEAARLAAHRSGVPVAQAARTLSGLDSHPVAIPRAKHSEPFLIWASRLEELLLQVEPDIEIPATFVYGAADTPAPGGILYFDDRGRWTELARNGPLARLAGALDRSAPHPAVLTVDLRGWGDTRPAFVPYEIAGWAQPERWLSYVSAALGDPILAMRIRDGLASLAYLRSRIGDRPIVVAGHGMGAVVALHVAVIDGRVRAVVADSPLASFRLLAEAESYAWDAGAFFPGVLRHYDLPELAATLKSPLLLINPLDAQKRPLASSTLYPPPIETVYSISADDAARRIREWIFARLQ